MNPQEIVLWKIIPAIKRDMTLILLNKGYKQKEIAGFLDLTPSAVSQYIHKKRATIELPSDAGSLLLESVDRIVNEKSSIKKEIVKILRTRPIISLMCEIHKREEPEFRDCKYEEVCE